MRPAPASAQRDLHRPGPPKTAFAAYPAVPHSYPGVQRTFDIGGVAVSAAISVPPSPNRHPSGPSTDHCHHHLAGARVPDWVDASGSLGQPN
ncbi:hypothetical protein K227x_21490 [Rubripirellula lacrimiformis]|uniref:Uncharacterized protein n=1 Tax=Rubripirellula lacrimiformis TaxID=1930273 RepID=A0A517N9F4_9BACT|nr:hypothetical protein K227x_21490 [Rubripirellula lacrimiformis]